MGTAHAMQAATRAQTAKLRFPFFSIPLSVFRIRIARVSASDRQCGADPKTTIKCRRLKNNSAQSRQNNAARA
jgi:hypothetical protein